MLDTKPHPVVVSEYNCCVGGLNAFVLLSEMSQITGVKEKKHL